MITTLGTLSTLGVVLPLDSYNDVATENETLEATVADVKMKVDAIIRGLERTAKC